MHREVVRSALLRRAFVVGAAGCALAVGGAPAAIAAPVCFPTTAIRDGHFLTAVEVDPGTVTGPVDATGCDIGVYVDAGHTTVTGATIQNARYFGILTEGSSASTDVSNSTIQNIGDAATSPNGTFSGAQHGIGIEWASGATGSIDSSVIKLYQKGGAVVADGGTQASVTNDTISGLGPVPFIAQNGVEYIDGASGTAAGNLITDNYYTGCTNKTAKQTGCVPYVAVGLLLYNVNPPDVKRFNNLYRDDQRNELVDPTAEVVAQSK